MGQIESMEWKPIVENLVHRIQDRNVHLNNSQKADMLKDALESLFENKGWSGASQNSRNQFIEQVQSCKRGVIPSWQDYRGFPNILINDNIPNAGFVTLIRDDQNAQVRSINCEDGPGKWIKAENGAREEFDLIVGYK
ncbi:hypothetical protein B9Z55_020898 [Caenorhabditis nigoni]|uniref:Uncharacterized protein n=1 Tax=Caenorhabditis nigoni TaxID=1611254 RepID=A0A2G5TPU1_9PELO|nr:hypothetical protein B9Z55_020898 [Caenorhabditis nigoni]